MKIRVKVIFPDRKVKWWFLSTESSACHYGQPVLVDDTNQPYGPADLPEGTLIKVESKHLLFAEGAKLAGYNIQN